MGCVIVRYNLTTSDSCLKALLNKLINRGGGVKSLGYRGMEVGTKANSCCRFLGTCWYGEAGCWC